MVLYCIYNKNPLKSYRIGSLSTYILDLILYSVSLVITL